MSTTTSRRKRFNYLYKTSNLNNFFNNIVRIPKTIKHRRATHIIQCVETLQKGGRKGDVKWRKNGQRLI